MPKYTLAEEKKNNEVDENTIKKMVDEAAEKIAKKKEEEIMNKPVTSKSGKQMRVIDIVNKGIDDGPCIDGKCAAFKVFDKIEQDGDTFKCSGPNCSPANYRLVSEEVVHELSDGYKCKNCGKEHIAPRSPKLRKTDKCLNCGGEEFIS